MPSVSAADFQGEMVILDAERGVFLGLDAIGSAIWHMLDRPMTMADLLDALAAEYDVPEGGIAGDLSEWLDELAGHGLILIG